MSPVRRTALALVLVALCLGAGVTLATRVVDEEDAPVPKADVTVQAESDATATDSDTTDGSGLATVAALPGARLVVRVAQDGYESVEHGGVRAGNETPRIVLSKKPPR